MPLPPNTTLGRYEIRSLLGAGGMGEVYLAKDTTLGRSVAIKLLPSDFPANQRLLHRFKREAFAASSLNHPNILTIYEIGAENALHFIVTEFIDGESLRQRMRHTTLDLREVLDIGIQVASALAAAHTAGIVHRDIKPENLMVRGDGFVKVLDFGLAKLIEHERFVLDREAPTETGHSVVIGTPSYMSPEQARGQAVDKRADIWGLGVVLYEMIAGRLPFAGETRSDIIAAILRTEPPILTRYAADTPAELERIVTKALKKDKEERYQGVKDLALDLKSLRQRLEFEAELNRTTSVEKRNSGAATGVSGSDTEATQSTATQSDGASAVTRTASRAKYLVNEIKRHKTAAPIALTVLLIAAMSMGYFLTRNSDSIATKTSSPDSIRSIAVLPFVNTSGNLDADYLSDGISESLINSLSQFPGVKVIASSSSFKYKGKEVDPQEVAQALGVEAIVAGRIAQRGENLSISVELVDARDKTQLWGEQYNSHAADLLQVQLEISRKIAEKLRLRLSAGQQQQLAKPETANPQAYELILKGRFYRGKGGLENRKKAIGYYQQAIAVDPAYALAYAELSISYEDLVSFSILDPKEFIPKAEEAARKALELDESLADAHYALANLKVDAWDWAPAEREYERAIELNPNLARAHSGYAFYLAFVKRNEQAIAEAQRAREIDPISLNVNANVGFILYLARRYDAAIEALQKTLELDPNYDLAHARLGYTYAAKGMYAEAIAAYQRSIKMGGDNTSDSIYLGAAYALSGQREKAQAILKELLASKAYVSPAELAVLYESLGERKEAFASLEKAYAAHDLQLQYISVDPVFDSLRSDPRFEDMMRRIGLTP